MTDQEIIEYLEYTIFILNKRLNAEPYVSEFIQKILDEKSDNIRRLNYIKDKIFCDGLKTVEKNTYKWSVTPNGWICEEESKCQK